VLRECGDDGCGGSCGLCAADRSCDGGACVCVPDCTGRTCGDDGCGGSCGSCRWWERCWELPDTGASQCTAGALSCDGVDPAAASLGLCASGGDCPATGECADLCGFATCTCSVDAACPAEAPVCGLIVDAYGAGGAGQSACLPRCPSGTDDECPPGLGCLLLWRADIAERVCAPPVHYVCGPCGADEDCHLVGDLCWDADGDGLGTCMAACAADSDCLPDFTCVATGGSAGASSHCLPVGGGGCS
jgi:hypothetical protein